MEVSLLDVEGLPKGCLVSVRSGTQRCQAPADPDKLRLFFPKGVQGPFKVDLLAPLGSAEIKYQPGANAYPIQVPINGKIGSLTIGVREMEKPNKLDLNAISTMEYTKDEKGRPATPSTASRRHRLALQARTYLEEHQLLVFVQSLLQGLIRDRPVDPWEYINETSTTAKKLGVPQPYKPGLTPRDQDTSFSPPTREAIPAFLQMFSPNGMTWSEYVAPSRPVVNEEGKLTGPWLELMRAAVAFEHSTPDWSSQAEFAEVGTAPSGAVNEFLESCGYGEFAEALAMVAGETHAQYEAVGNAADGGRAAGEATPVVSLSRPESAHRTGAKSKETQLSMDTMNQALASLEEVQLPFAQRPSVGTWLSVPATRSREVAAAITPEASLLEPNPEDVLRDIVLKVLEQASHDGTMDKLASQMNSMEKLRGEASKQLLQAAADGSLLKVVPEAVASAEAEAAASGKIKKLQSKARTALLEAGDTGKLAEALAKQQQQAAKAPASPLSPELASLKGEMKRLLVQAAERGTFEKALQDLSSSTAPAPPLLPWYPLPDISSSAAATIMATPAVQAAKRAAAREVIRKAEDEAAVTRRRAQEMLKQAMGSDPTFLTALQEAAEAAGYDLVLQPKPKASAWPTLADESSDVEAFHVQARANLVEASLDGRFIQALEEVSGGIAAQAVFNQGENLCEGDEVIERKTTRRFNVTGKRVTRAGTEVLLEAQDGSRSECWKSESAVEKIPKLNLTSAISIAQTEVCDAPDAPRLHAPGFYADVGEEVQCTGDPLRKGIVRQRTTTDLLVQMDDGTEAWHEVEDLEQVLLPGNDAEEGQQVVATKNGMRGSVKKRTQAEVLILHDDGSEEWHSADNVGRVRSRGECGRMVDVLSEDDMDAAKENAREALANALFSSSHEALPTLPKDEIEVAKENARDALMSAFLSSEADPSQDGCLSDEIQRASLTRPDMEIEASEANAREELAVALWTAEEQEDIASAASNSVGSEVAKDNARAAIEAALLASPEEVSSQAPEDQKQLEAASEEKKPQEPKSEPPPEEQKQAEAQAEAQVEAPGDAEVQLIHTRNALPPQSETLQALDAATVAELDQKLRTRNERFIAENGALKRENKRLQALLDRKQYAEKTRAGPDAS